MSTPNKGPDARWKEAFLAAYKRLPGNRHYALNDDALRAGGAFAKAYADKAGFDDLIKGDLDRMVEKLATHLGELRQQRAVEPEKIVWPVDPVTNERLPNPWESGGNLGERNAVHKLSPRLAQYFERRAKEGPWKLHIESLEKAAEVAEINAIKYDSEVHKTNPFVSGTMSQQNDFIRANSPDFPREGLRVAFERREAVPISLPFSHATPNMTKLGVILKGDEELGKLCMAAQEIEKGWLLEAERVARQEEKEAKQKLQDLQNRTRGIVPDDDRLAAVRKVAARPER
jgi:hypothetical protein